MLEEREINPARRGFWEITIRRVDMDGQTLTNTSRQTLQVFERAGPDATVSYLAYVAWKLVVALIRHRDDNRYWYPKWPSEEAVVRGAHNE